MRFTFAFGLFRRTNLNAIRNFQSHSLRFLLLAVCLFFSLLFAHAQSSTTGAIGGTVADSGGALLPSVTITVKSAETGFARTVRSNASGEYLVPELEPGNYSATFTADGFEIYQENAIVVTVGSLSTVSPMLKVGSVADSVTVTDETPAMHSQSNDISTTLDQASLDNLPINGRRWSNFALLTPGVVSNSNGFGLLSFRGISFLLNNNTVDGADDNQAYFSEARGRTRASYSITQVAVQEFQVNTSNYSAQYGRSAGGVINTVTKSGTNKLRGELFFYDRDNNLGGATNPYNLIDTANAQGVYSSTPYNPTDRRKQWGFGTGGPLLRNKIFWFYAYDQVSRNFPGTGRAPDPNHTFAPSNSSPAAGESCTATLFTITTLSLSSQGDYNACAIAAAFGVNYQTASADYEQGLGVISSYLGTVPRTLAQVINLPKVDFQINERNRLSLMYNRMRESSPNGYQTTSSVFYGRGSFGNDFVKEDFGIARLSSVLSTSIINDVLVQYGRDFESSLSDNPLPNELPMSNNAFGKPPQIQIAYEFQSDGFKIGKNEELDRKALPNERRLQLLDGATWSHGKHVSKAGLEFNRVLDYTNNLYNGNGNYRYNYSYNFAADYLHITRGLGGTGYTSLYNDYGQGFGNPSGEIATSEYAGYATDDWRILPKLTLTLGIRYEYEYIPPNPNPNTGNPALVAAFSSTPLASQVAAGTALPQTADRPDDRNNIAPRIGFAWNVFGKDKTILRGGFGMYYGRIINSNILQTYMDSGATNAQISLTTSGGNSADLYAGHCGPVFPNLINSITDVYNCFAGLTTGTSKTPVSPLGALATPTPPTTTVAYLDPHMQNPQIFEGDLAIEQNLGHSTVFGLTYMMSLGRELPTAIDTNFNLQNSYSYSFTVAAPVSTAPPLSYAVNATAAPGYSKYPQPVVTGYVTQPNGGAKAPLTVGQTYTTRVYLQPAGAATQTRPNPAYGEILDVRSNVNSSYNALAVQLNHRYEHGIELLMNYTLSHALDDNSYLSTSVPTYTAYDPNNLSLEHGNSALDFRQRFVFAAIYQPQTHFHGVKDKVIGGWRISPIIQMQTGLPFTPTVSGTAGSLTVPDGTDGCTAAVGCTAIIAYDGLNGSGSSADRLPWIDRNTYHYPKTAVVDGRLGKSFFINAPHFDRLRLEVFGEVFNIMNHQNITGIVNEAYSLASTTLTQQANFGTYDNANSNYTYSPRQIQLAARLHF